jgi:nucleotide-binding universal stress UspA family protein
VSGLRRVVVGVSGSPASIRALRIGSEHARQADVPLLAVHAWVPPGGDLAERRYPSPELRAIWKRVAAERLKRSIVAAWGGLPADVSLEHVVARGPAGPALVGIADSYDDMLVVGAGRRGCLVRIWSGKVARYCQAHARCPVLAVPPPALAATRWSAWSLRHRELTADQVLRDLAKPARGNI